MKEISISQAHALTRPLPYTLITSLDREGNPNALGVSWVTRTSLDPYLITISIDEGRYSHECLKECGEFVVHYPTKDQEKGAWLCGVKSGRDINKLREAGLELIPSKMIKVPTIKDVAVAIECIIMDKFTTGDHTVFVGKVVAATCHPKHPPHLYYGGEGLMTLK